MKQIISFSEEYLDLNVLKVVPEDNAEAEFRNYVIERAATLLDVDRKTAEDIMDNDSDETINLNVYGVNRGYDGYASVDYKGYIEYMRMVDVPLKTEVPKRTGLTPKPKHYFSECIISADEENKINHYLTNEPQSEQDCFGENDVFVKTVKFENGKQMDIKMCGVQYEEGESNLPWTEAVLFDENGAEITCTEPSDEYFGEWCIEHDNDTYVVNVHAAKENATYIMLITYSFDTDYVVVPKATEKEAIGIMNKYLQDEVDLVTRESEYTPKVIEMSETEKVLVYFDYDDDYDHHDDYYEHDYATYKVVEVNLPEGKKDDHDEPMEVHTSAGVLRAYKSADPGQPGICVMLQPAGKESEIDLSYVSVYEDPEYQTEMRERPVDVSIMTYADAFDEDYTSKDIIRREDVLAALSE